MDDLSAINLDMPLEQLLKNESLQEKSPQLTAEVIPMEKDMHIPEDTETVNLLDIVAVIPMERDMHIPEDTETVNLLVIAAVIEMANESATDQDIEPVKETVIAVVIAVG